MRGSPVRFADFSGGVNRVSRTSPVFANSSTEYEHTAPNQATDARNVVCNSKGLLVKRNGNVTLSAAAQFPTGTAILSIIGFRNDFASANVNDKFVAVTDGAIYSVDIGTGTATAITGAVTTGSQEHSFVSMDNAGTQTLYAGSISSKFKWTGSGNAVAWAPGPLTVTANFMCIWRNRIYMANHNRVIWSDPGQPDTFQNTNFVDIDPGDGDEISGIAAFGSYLVIFKRHKTYLIYDDATGANRLVSDNVGCGSYRSITDSPLGLIFQGGDRKVRVFNGASFKEISQHIEPNLPRTWSPFSFRNRGAYFNGRYFLSPADSSLAPNVPNSMLEFDIATGSWWVHTNCYRDMTVVKDSNNNDQLIGATLGAKQLDKMYQPSVFTDNGSAMNAFWLSQWFTLQEPYRHWRIRRISADGFGPVNFRLRKNIDNATYYAPQQGLSTNMFTTVSDLNEARINSPAMAAGFDVTTDVATGTTFGVPRSLLYYFTGSSSAFWGVGGVTFFVDRRMD